MELNRKNVFVVVPFYNEEKLILSNLEALLKQTDQEFSLILVDNNSNDKSIDVVNKFKAHHPTFKIEVISEMTKGTGSAVNTGFAYAISKGATHILRTDSDCLPKYNWVELIKKRFEQGYEFVTGIQMARKDDGHYRFYDDVFYSYCDISAGIWGNVLRPKKGFKYPFILAPGNNIGITRDLYLKTGGFTRSKIEDIHEDLDLSEKIRKLTTKAIKDRKIVTYTSMRRIRKWGYFRSWFWYADHKYKPKIIDIR